MKDFFRSKRGFSLVELLVVIAVFAVLAGIVGIAVTNVGKAGALTKAATDIAGILEQARAQAMAQNTYVWVGFKNDADTVMVGVVGSKNGEAAPAASGLVQLGRLRRFENLRIVEGLPNGDGPEQRPQVPEGGNLLDSTDAILDFQVGSVNFNQYVIQFNSLGEARMNSLTRYIEIGLQSAVKGNIVNPANFAVVQVGGLSGSVGVYRP